jgi:hypothetical protein
VRVRRIETLDPSLIWVSAAQTITAETVSFAAIKALRAEAHAANDSDMGAICDLAIDGTIDMDDYTTVSSRMSARLRTMTREQAYALCADAINAATTSGSCLIMTDHRLTARITIDTGDWVIQHPDTDEPFRVDGERFAQNYVVVEEDSCGT